MDKTIDDLIKILRGTSLNVEEVKTFKEELYNKKLIRLDSKGRNKVAPEIYERLAQLENKNQIIFSALNDGYNFLREGLARKIFDYNPLAFLSVEEIKELLTPEKIEEFNLSSSSVESLIRATGEIEQYLTRERIEELWLDSSIVERLIKATGKIEQYLTKEKIRELGLNGESILILIKATGKIEQYLTKEKIKELGLDRKSILELIKATGKIEQYLTKEKIKELDLGKEEILILIKATGKIEQYLTKEIIKAGNLNGNDLVSLLFGDVIVRLAHFIDEEIENGTYDVDKIIRMRENMESLKNSNSDRLSRISEEIAFQIYSLPLEEQERAIKVVKDIYLTKNLPIVAQNFLIFKQLHPILMGDDNALYSDSSYGNIPSLQRATPRQRNRIIFSDLLRIALESNSRNLRDYLSIIERGDRLFSMLKEGQLQIDESLPEDDRKDLEKYRDILNTLYSQTSKGKRTKVRVSSENLGEDLEELEGLFSSDTNIQRSLPDRIVRMFGYWAGIKDFEQAKRLIEQIPKEADKRNRDAVQKGKFILERGDFAKGIQDTEYFPSMLQNGIIARDYLGQNSSSDGTPFDMDVELIGYKAQIKMASSYTDSEAYERKFGKIIIVIKNDDSFVETRSEEGIDELAVQKVLRDKSKKEYFSNGGNAYGIRTGVGSTNISYIIVDNYKEKLGLEIAKNGFYIPIVDENGNLLFTPEMYDELRSKMQGMSYYGITEYKVDESARNEGTKKLAELVGKNKEGASSKRSIVMQTLERAIEKCGLKMSDKRTLDLLPGIVEVIDTGSTGRGTSEFGEGDFDFIVRLDNKVLRNSGLIMQEIKKALSAISHSEEEIATDNGIRYKGVSIQGLADKIDLDLTFVQRTDEIEYTTEECIIDRLETIKRNNPEDYKYVVANILLAKKVLKTEGVYKKKSSPPPKEGEGDTRGGLGAIGIENWILQNGGSFEKAARDFLSVSRTCKNLRKFRGKYAIWNFGENYMAGNNYPHDNFVDNMNEQGYEKMKRALEEYIRAIELEGENESKKKSLGEIVQEDISVLNDTTYMISVENLLAKARRTRCSKVRRKGKIYNGKC